MSQDSVRADGLPAPRPRSRRRLLLALVRAAFGVAIVVAVVLALAGSWAEVSAQLRRIEPVAVAAALGGVLIGIAGTTLGWRALLADLGSPLPLAPAAGIYCVGQLGKYLPGGLWAVLAQADLAATHGVPRRRTAVAGLLTLALSVLVGLPMSVPAVPAVLTTLVAPGGGAAGARGVQGEGVPAAPVLLAILAAVGAGLLVALHPRVLARLLDLALRVLRRPPLEQVPSGPGLRRAAAWFVLGWLGMGAHAWVLAVAAGAAPAGSLAPAVCGYALATCAGLVVVVAPAGAGVREVVLVLVLAPVLPTPAAAAVALGSRAVVTLADVLAAVWGWGWARRHARRSEPEMITEP